MVPVRIIFNESREIISLLEIILILRLASKILNNGRRSSELGCTDKDVRSY